MIEDAWPHLRSLIPGLPPFDNSTPHDVNKRSHGPVTWEQLDAIGYGKSIRKRAKRYGYAS